MLQEEVEACVALQNQLKARHEGMLVLDAAVQHAIQPCTARAALLNKESGIWKELRERANRLAECIQEAESKGTSVTSASIVMSEIESQLGAADQAWGLDDLLSQGLANTLAMKTAIKKAKESAASASAHQACGHDAGLKALRQSLKTAQARLDIEQAKEALQKVVSATIGLTDLAKLEDAILLARKEGVLTPHDIQ